MYNWNIDKRKIYLDHLKRGMFRKVGNQYKFNNVKFMIDELDAIRLEELSGPNVKDVRNEELFSGVERNEEESHPHVVPVDVQPIERTKHTEAVVNFEKQFMLVCKQLSNLEAKVDANHVEMKNFIMDFFKNLLVQLTSQRKVDSRNENPSLPKGTMHLSICMLVMNFQHPPWRLNIMMTQQ